MTNEQMKRLDELEAEFAEFLADAKTTEEKHKKCHHAVWTAINYDKSDREYLTFCKDNFRKLDELMELYEKYSYDPEKDEKRVAYLFREGMTKEEKLSALANAGWTARNSGYCDAMANRLAAGQGDDETDRWQKNCDNQYAIERYYDWLKEQKD